MSKAKIKAHAHPGGFTILSAQRTVLIILIMIL